MLKINAMQNTNILLFVRSLSLKGCHPNLFWLTVKNVGN